MNFAICIFAILSPALCWAQLAGNWAGVTVDSQASHRIVLHISGPFTAMQATADIPDQKVVGASVESITFSDATLQFSLPASDARYSGVVNDKGAIVGTFTQHGVGVPLVLARVASGPVIRPDIPTQGSGVVENGRYIHKPSGVEFDLPSGWLLNRTQFSNGGPGESSIFTDPSGKATVFSVAILSVHTDADKIPGVLARTLPGLLAMRAGQGAPRQMTPNYKVRDGSVEQTVIGGHQATRAIGEFTSGGKGFGELLAWIDTENTRTYFFLRALADDLPALQAPFDQILQSAKIP